MIDTQATYLFLIHMTIITVAFIVCVMRAVDYHDAPKSERRWFWTSLAALVVSLWSLFEVVGKP